MLTRSKLYKILGKAIDQLYNENVDVEEPPDMLNNITSIWALDNELQTWQSDLSKNHKTATHTEVDMIFSSINLAAPVLLDRRFQFILTLRYLNLRLLLHRPVLTRFFESIYSPMLELSEPSILKTLGSRSLLTCFRCSMEIIAIVSRIASEKGSALRYLSAWWFTLYYSTSAPTKSDLQPANRDTSAFNAALIVFGIMVVCHESGQTILHAPSRMSCKEGVEQAIKALEQIDPGNNIIQRCHDYLLSLLAASNTFGEFYSRPFDVSWSRDIADIRQRKVVPQLDTLATVHILIEVITWKPPGMHLQRPPMASNSLGPGTMEI